jgi:hypothetical protein
LIGPAVACQTTAMATISSTINRFTTTSWNIAKGKKAWPSFFSAASSDS